MGAKEALRKHGLRQFVQGTATGVASTAVMAGTAYAMRNLGHDMALRGGAVAGALTSVGMSHVLHHRNKQLQRDLRRMNSAGKDAVRYAHMAGSATGHGAAIAGGMELFRRHLQKQRMSPAHYVRDRQPTSGSARSSQSWADYIPGVGAHRAGKERVRKTNIGHQQAGRPMTREDAARAYATGVRKHNERQWNAVRGAAQGASSRVRSEATGAVWTAKQIMRHVMPNRAASNGHAPRPTPQTILRLGSGR